MNYTKYQKEIVNTLLSGGRVRYDVITDDSILISNDGCVALILSEKQIVFSLNRCIKTEFAKVVEKTEDDTEIRHTTIFRRDTRGDMNKWRSDKFDIWMRAGYEKMFEGQVKFFASSPTSRILVTTYNDIPLGIIMPVRAPNEQSDA